MTPYPSKDEHQPRIQLFSWKRLIFLLPLTIGVIAILLLLSTPRKPDGIIVILPEFSLNNSSDSIAKSAIYRNAIPKTINTSSEKYAVIEYTIKEGENIFTIAEDYGLEPETIFWANQDNYCEGQFGPTWLPGMTIRILPVDGIYIQFQDGMSLSYLAETYNVSIEDIVYYPGNHLETDFLAPEKTKVANGRWLVIPGGTRELQDWPSPITPRTLPVGKYYGSGYCNTVSNDGPISEGNFIWPTESSTISGYTWNPPIHEAIDIGNSEGDPIYASDAGVIVYSGWSEYGYGNLVVIDHGNGWQTTYAHLLSIHVECGDKVYQGDIIGELGNTGNSYEPHLHFEMSFNGTNYNPLDYVLP